MATAVVPYWLRLTDGGMLGAVLLLTCQTFHAHRTVDSAGLAIALACALVFVLKSSWYSLEMHTIGLTSIGLAYPLLLLAVTWLVSGELLRSPQAAFVHLTQAPEKYLAGTCCMTVYQVRGGRSSEAVDEVSSQSPPAQQLWSPCSWAVTRVAGIMHGTRHVLPLSRRP
jgi:hypothetical protein